MLSSGLSSRRNNHNHTKITLTPMCLALPVLSSSSVRILAWLVVSLCTVVSMALGCAFVGSAQLLVVFNSVVVLGFWLRQSTSVECLTLALSLAFGYVNLPVSIGSQYCSALVFWLLGFGFGLSAWLSKALRQRAATTLRGRIVGFEGASTTLRRCIVGPSMTIRRHAVL